MYSRAPKILLLISFLLLLMHPGPAPFPHSGAASSKQMLGPLQDCFSASNPKQEKRNEDASVQKIEEIFRLVHPERSTKIHRLPPFITNDLADFSSLLVYSQTTSSFL
jgi:hypothetical protein